MGVWLYSTAAQSPPYTVSWCGVDPDRSLLGPSLHVWGHDHDGAYRQLPIKDPELALLVLVTSAGPTVWQHLVAPFGSKATVWAYNRLGDAAVVLARLMLAILCLHYVDDYGAVERPSTAPLGV